MEDKVAVIMAGGEGKRLGALTSDIPKPMIDVAGKPMIEIIMDRLRTHGYTKLYVSVYHKKEVIKHYLKDGRAFGVHIEYLEEECPLGTAGSLSLLPAMTSDFIVMNADLITGIDFAALEQHHRLSTKIATVGVHYYEHQVPFGVVHVNGKQDIVHIEEKPLYSALTSSGIYVFKPEVLNHVPKETRLDMPDLLKTLVSHHDIGIFPIFEFWHDVGRIEDLTRARAQLAPYAS